MPKSVMPFYEPKPYYMTVMGMQCARFIEGNDGSGSGDDGAGKAADEAGKQEASGKADEDKKLDDDFKSPESKAAVLADLQKERDQRKTFQAQVTERETQVQTLTESLTESASTIAERDAQLAAKDAEIAILKLGVSNEEDIALLTSITDTEKREALAKRLTVNSSIVRRKDGTDDSPATGSLAGGRDLYKSRKK